MAHESKPIGGSGANESLFLLRVRLWSQYEVKSNQSLNNFFFFNALMVLKLKSMQFKSEGRNSLKIENCYV